MIDDRYFHELGEPSAARFERLPIWLRIYIRGLKVEIACWYLLAQGRRVTRRRVVCEPTPERLSKVPVFAFDWVSTLRFELFWWRSQAFKRVRTTEVAGSLYAVEA